MVDNIINDRKNISCICGAVKRTAGSSNRGAVAEESTSRTKLADYGEQQEDISPSPTLYRD